jgi:hypothetical protein
MGGTLGDITPSRQIRKQMLTTKCMGSFKIQNLLEGAHQDVRSRRVNNLSADECATQRLVEFNVQSAPSYYEYGREMSDLYRNLRQ